MAAGGPEIRNPDWIPKLFNMCMLLGGLELFVIVDQYRVKKQGDDVNLQAFARINPKKILDQIIRSKANGAHPLSEDEDELHAYIVSQVLSLCWGQAWRP